MVSGGYGTSAGNTGTNTARTFLDTANTIDSNGSIKSWSALVGGTGTIKLKIFRTNGANYDVVWSSDAENFSITPWDNVAVTFNLKHSVPVLTGDLVGYYITSNSSFLTEGDNGGTGVYEQGSDIMAQTTTASWTSSGFRNLRMAVSSNQVTVLYVKTGGDNTKSGSSWTDAKNDIKDGLNSIATSGNLHIGFGDYSGDSGIKFDKSLTLTCETEDSSWGAGTVNLPKAAWSQCDFNNTALDRQNTDNSGLDTGYISLYRAQAQRFIPASRCLQKITLKLQRVLNQNLYIEIREDSGGAPQGNPQNGTGQVGYITVDYSTITTLSLTDYDFTFNLDMGNTNPKWIVVTTTTYDPNSADDSVIYNIGGGQTYGTRNEYYGIKIQTDSWLTNTVANLYFKTTRGI